jgi:hypothetical protein
MRFNPLSGRSGNLSRLAHNRVFSDTDESLCSRAWRRRGYVLFWALWVRVFGRGHCHRAFQLHHHIRRLRHDVPPCYCFGNRPP